MSNWRKAQGQKSEYWVKAWHDGLRVHVLKTKRENAENGDWNIDIRPVHVRQGSDHVIRTWQKGYGFPVFNTAEEAMEFVDAHPTMEELHRLAIKKPKSKFGGSCEGWRGFCGSDLCS